jgi:gamma-glutamyltranspeptidase/glutathione hydrolase
MGHDSPDYIHTLIEAMKLSYADRDSYYGDQTFVHTPGEGLLSKTYASERALEIDPKRASRSFIAGDPFRFDSTVKEWPYWRANEVADDASRTLPMDTLLASAGIPKDTTHMSVIDKDGNMFDTTSSGGWISGAVILGDTGIGMSIRGEQFWLDPSRANQLRPRARPRYTLTPSLVQRDDKPFMAIGTPGGDNQEQTILQAFLDVVEFWDDWYPNLHTAFAWPRVQTMHFYGSVWPHDAGFNRMNVEAPIPGAVIDELKARGHQVETIRQYGVSGCATAVMIDPATGNRLAGADPRRDCYAMAY